MAPAEPVGQTLFIYGTGCNTHKGLFVYNRCPFEIKPAAAIFQHNMENLLEAIPNVVVFQDDALITGRNDAEHFCNIEAVLKRLVEADVEVKRDKCRFMLPEVEFLGRIASADGIRPSKSRIQAIGDVPTPANTTELKEFLGVLNYCCNFFPNLSAVLEPLHKLHKMLNGNGARSVVRRLLS